MRLRYLSRLLLLLVVVWCAAPASAEPVLPAGLDSPSSEPALPAGMGGGGDDDPWADDEGDSGWDGGDNWGELEEEEISPSGFPFTGFWETRLGNRLSSADNQRQGTLAETRLELEKDVHWQGGGAKLTGDLVYDAIEDSRGIDLESGAGWLDLREAWFNQQLGSQFDLKAGRQVLTWGVGDLVFINDLFPKDWNSFLSGRDEQYLKAPSDAFRLGFYSDTVNINLVYTPRFDADRFIDGRRLSYFSPLYGQVVGQNGLLEADVPDHSGKDDELAFRAYRSVARYEMALYGYRGFWKSPGGFNPMTGEAIFPRLDVLGMSARGPLGPGILSLEAGYYFSRDDRGGHDAFINNDELRALAGYEREVATDTTLGLQYYVEVLQDYRHYRDSLFPGQTVRDEYRQLLTARLTRLAMNQNLTLGLFVFFSPTDRDGYLRPKVIYKVNDQWTLEGGLNLFSGERDNTFFGQFEDNSNVYASVRYGFQAR